MFAEDDSYRDQTGGAFSIMSKKSGIRQGQESDAGEAKRWIRNRLHQITLLSFSLPKITDVAVFIYCL